MISHLTAATFEKEIASGLTVVDFWADWCGPCKMMAPVLEQLSTELKAMKFAKVNVDEEPAVSGKFNIRGIPTLIAFKDGKEFARIVGLAPKEKLKGDLQEIIRDASQ